MSHRLVMSASSSSAVSIPAPESKRESRDEYVTVINSMPVGRSLGLGANLKPFKTHLRVETYFDLTGSSTIFSKMIPPNGDTMLASLAKLFDEIKFETVTITMDSRDFLHNMMGQSPSTSLVMASSAFAASNLLTTDPPSYQYVWDSGNATIMEWSEAHPVVKRTFKVRDISYISTGVAEAHTEDGFYSMSRVAAMSSTDFQLLRCWLGLSEPYNSSSTITHSYVNCYIDIGVTVRKRRGAQ